jgi:predicted patatin/cPLA2 family phospholipase
VNDSVGLILEGGAMRSIFSAGILDFFMEKGIEIPNVLAVSAGAYVGMNYASGQQGRCMKALVEPMKEYKYMGLGTFFKKGTFFDMDYLFYEVPKTRSQFDFEAFRNFKGRFITSTVDCSTGETVYHEKFCEEKAFYDTLKAANSMPLIAKVVNIDGKPMLDGGMADAIPINKALEEGWKKLIVVLTRDVSYRKREKATFDIRLTNWFYRKYPKFVDVLAGRAKRYNDAIDTIAKLEADGRAFVLRPTDIVVGNDESDVERLTAYYQHGYNSVKARYEELLKFLET